MIQVGSRRASSRVKFYGRNRQSRRNNWLYYELNARRNYDGGTFGSICSRSDIILIFQRAFPRFAKISLYSLPAMFSAGALCSPALVRVSPNRQRRRSEDSRRVTRPEILDFNCAPDISAERGRAESINGPNPRRSCNATC